MLDRRKLRYTYLRLSKRIKDFLLSDKSREFLIFLFFFLIACGLWMIQNINNDYEAEFSIPVRMKDAPNNIVLTSEPPSELRVRVKDKGTVLLNYMLGKSFFPVNLSFPDYKGQNNHVKIFASEFEKKILSQLNASSKILSIKPDTLDYIYSTGKSKLVPVHFQGKVTAGLQYYVSDTICNPDSVLVYAPEGILDTITTAYTQKINLENISDNMLMGAVNAFNGKTNSVLNQLNNEYEAVSAVAKQYKANSISSIVVAEENYGEGSSREHAAMEPRFLNVKVILAKSFARIHETNLKKQGMLALTFANKEDYSKIRENDHISIIGLKDFQPGKPLTAVLLHADGTQESFPVNHTYNDLQIKWFKAGSALNTAH